MAVPTLRVLSSQVPYVWTILAWSPLPCWWPQLLLPLLGDISSPAPFVKHLWWPRAQGETAPAQPVSTTHLPGTVSGPRSWKGVGWWAWRCCPHTSPPFPTRWEPCLRKTTTQNPRRERSWLWCPHTSAWFTQDWGQPTNRSVCYPSLHNKLFQMCFPWGRNLKADETGTSGSRPVMRWPANRGPDLICRFPWGDQFPLTWLLTGLRSSWAAEPRDPCHTTWALPHTAACFPQDEWPRDQRECTSKIEAIACL